MNKPSAIIKDIFIRIVSPILLLSVFACKSEDHDYFGEDITPPSLSLISPFDNEEFGNGDNIIIQGKSGDKNGLHDLHIYLVKMGTTDTLANYFKHIDHMKTYDLNEMLEVGGITMETSVVMTILMEDHYFNATVASINILLKP